MKRYLPFIIIAAVLVVAIIAGVLMFRSSEPQTPTTVTTSSTVNNTLPAAISPKSSVTIEEFGDYQCPPCGTLHPTLKTIKTDYGDRVRFVFYQLPLTQIHKHALPAAQAAVAAGIQGHFWEMHDLLYQNQAGWSEASDLRPIVISFAQRLGLNPDRLVSDMDSPQVNATISENMRRAESLGVNATPTLLIDGQIIPNEKISIDYLRQEINTRLGKEKK